MLRLQGMLRRAQSRLGIIQKQWSSALRDPQAATAAMVSATTGVAVAPIFTSERTSSHLTNEDPKTAMIPESVKKVEGKKPLWPRKHRQSAWGIEHTLPIGANLIIIGDVHGCYDEFCELLAKAQFNPARGDVVVLTGDLVGKGPKSIDVRFFSSCLYESHCLWWRARVYYS